MSAVTDRSRVPWDRVAVSRAMRARGMAGGLIVCGLLAGSCGSLSDSTPTRPDPTPPPGAPAVAPTADPNASPTPTPVLAGPAPKPTPTPEASPGPTPAPSPPAEDATACGSPTPPELSMVAVAVHLRGSEAWVLDSTPLVGPDPAYCAAIGFTDGRRFCPVRPEGHPQRVPCETYVTGRAADTGRPGPTWYLGTSFCTGRSSGCENHPENQYQLLVYSGGTFRACGKNGVCGEVVADR